MYSTTTSAIILYHATHDQGRLASAHDLWLANNCATLNTSAGCWVLWFFSNYNHHLKFLSLDCQTYHLIASIFLKFSIITHIISFVDWLIIFFGVNLCRWINHHDHLFQPPGVDTPRERESFGLVIISWFFFVSLNFVTILSYFIIVGHFMPQCPTFINSASSFRFILRCLPYMGIK